MKDQKEEHDWIFFLSEQDNIGHTMTALSHLSEVTLEQGVMWRNSHKWVPKAESMR